MEMSRLQWIVVLGLAAVIFTSAARSQVANNYNSNVHPSFLSTGETFRVVQGDTLALPCEADNIGDFFLLWKRGKAVLTAGHMMITKEKRMRLVDGFNLEIVKVQPQDAGDYICQISTDPPQEQVHTVEILVPPTIRRVPDDGQIIVRKGSTVTLECRTSGNPVPTITWTRKNNLLPSGEKSVEGFSVTIERADRHQAGLYQCTASNGVGSSITAEINLQVLYPPDIDVERSWIHSGEGYEAELVCIVHAEPPSTVLWYRDTLLLDTTERRLMEDRGSRHTLIIRNVQPSDFGNYSCLADNTLGKARQYLELSGRPNQAVFRSDPVGRLRDSYNITWAVESYTPVEQYRLLYRELHVNDSYETQSSWHDVIVPATSVLPSDSFVHVQYYVIRNLEPDTLYEALVRAKNKYGWNEVSSLFQFSTRVDEPEMRDLTISAVAASGMAMVLAVPPLVLVLGFAAPLYS